MARKHSQFNDYLVYIVLRVLGCALQAMPGESAQRLARNLAHVAYRLNRRHREVALDNLRQAFPGRYNEEELHGLVLDVYRHFAGMLLEMLLLPRKLTPGNWLRYITGDDMEYQRLMGLLQGKRALFFVTAHYGNWELAAYWLSVLGFRSYLVARPLDNPYLDRFVRQFRERRGHRSLPKTGGLEDAQKALSAGGSVCAVADQDAGSRGMFVPFFGRSASTHRGIALMSLLTDAVVVVVGARNSGSFLHYTFHMMDVIYPEEHKADADPVRSITERMTLAVERLVRLDVRQYLWLHRRWKHQPKTAAAA